MIPSRLEISTACRHRVVIANKPVRRSPFIDQKLCSDGPRPVLSLLISLLAPRLDRANFINLIIYPMSQSTSTTRNPWSWVPSGYFAEGIPYVMITWVAATMFKDLGHSDTEITFWGKHYPDVVAEAPLGRFSRYV